MKKLLLTVIPVVVILSRCAATAAPAGPSEVVIRAIESVTGILNAPKEEQAARLENFSGCFLEDGTRRDAFLSLIFTQASDYAILHEKSEGAQAKVLAELKTSNGPNPVLFDLERVKDQWLISSVHGDEGCPGHPDEDKPGTGGVSPAPGPDPEPGKGESPAPSHAETGSSSIDLKPDKHAFSTNDSIVLKADVNLIGSPFYPVIRVVTPEYGTLYLERDKGFSADEARYMRGKEPFVLGAPLRDFTVLSLVFSGLAPGQYILEAGIDTGGGTGIVDRETLLVE